MSKLKNMNTEFIETKTLKEKDKELQSNLLVLRSKDNEIKKLKSELKKRDEGVNHCQARKMIFC